MYPFMRGVVRLMLMIVSVAILCGTMMAAGEKPKDKLVATSLLGQNEWQAGETASMAQQNTRRRAAAQGHCSLALPSFSFVMDAATTEVSADYTDCEDDGGKWLLWTG